MKVLRLFSRIIAGLVFIFSGVVKAIDPLGLTYKLHDYFQAFDINFLKQFSLPLAILLCTAEFIAGFSVLTGIRQKEGIWAIMILMVIFTPLTLVLAISNPVSDCGCFGDAVHLTNWQTFGKNIILLAFAIILFAGRKKIRDNFNQTSAWITISAAILLFVLFSFFNLRYLPIIDFLPYKTGTNIPEKMVVPPGAKPDAYSTTFIYEKNGRQQEFTLNNYPSNDTTWKFVDQKSVLIKKGYQPPIHDLSIRTLNGEDLTQKILSDTSYSLLMISKKMEEAGSKNLSAGFELGNYCLGRGENFYVLTASGTDLIKSKDNRIPFCLTDETTLKTMVRSNPGYILLRGGTIIGKWSWANVPEKEWFLKKFSQDLQLSK